LRRRVGVYRGRGEANVIAKPLKHFSDDLEDLRVVVHD
jgi:hypothetical protein